MTIAIWCGTITYGKTAYVNAPSGLRLRAEASTDSEVLKVFPYGTVIEVERYNNQWKATRDGELAGYIKAEYLTYEKQTEKITPNNKRTLLGTWLITAYTHTGNLCANGNYPTAGYTIACNDLPFGTQVYIEGIGNRTVEDTGPPWSEWADVFMDSYNECINWGTQYRNVYLVE